MAQSPFPRNTLLLSLHYLPDMEHWDSKDQPDEPQARTNSQEEDFPFGGDMVGATAEIDYVPAHFLTLMSVREIFNIMTPMVAMDDAGVFKPLEEEQLAVLKLTDTLNFTLSLTLNFHGDDDRKGTKMLEMLSNIRFLKELKLRGRITKEDFIQIGKMAFLTSLELNDVPSLTDDYFVDLAKNATETTPTNLKSLTIRFCRRITNTSIAQIPIFAPNLQKFELSCMEQIKPKCVDCFADHPAFIKNLKSLTLNTRVSSSCWISSVVNRAIIKMENLEELHIRYAPSLTEEVASRIIRHCRNLKVVDFEFGGFRYGNPVSPKLVKRIGKYLGDTVTSLRLTNTFNEYYHRFGTNGNPVGVYDSRLESYLAFCFGDQLENVDFGRFVFPPLRVSDSEDTNNHNTEFSSSRHGKLCGSELRYFMKSLREGRAKFSSLVQHRFSNPIKAVSEDMLKESDSEPEDNFDW